MQWDMSTIKLGLLYHISLQQKYPDLVTFRHSNIYHHHHHHQNTGFLSSRCTMIVFFYNWPLSREADCRAESAPLISVGLVVAMSRHELSHSIDSRGVSVQLLFIESSIIYGNTIN